MNFNKYEDNKIFITVTVSDRYDYLRDAEKREIISKKYEEIEKILFNGELDIIGVACIVNNIVKKADKLTKNTKLKC